MYTLVLFHPTMVLSHSVPSISQTPTTHNAKSTNFPISSSGFRIPSHGICDSLEKSENKGEFRSISVHCCNPWLPSVQRCRLVSNSRFNFGRLGNGGGAVRVRCGGPEEGGGGGEEEEDLGFYMRRAVDLARKAIGCTSPNPMVGCVIVKDGVIVGEGFHPKAGQPHAEVFALRSAGGLAENATAYVSLEPCNHYGKTPPCTEALIEAKVKKVVIGMVDPNPIVASRGVNRLRDAGIEVIVGVEEDLCRRLNEAYIHKMLIGKPLVTLRYTISIDGVILDQLGEGVAESGGYYSKLLQEYDAIIHSSTTLARNSFFPVSREPKARQPLLILVAKSPASPISIPSLAAESDRKAIVFTDREATAVLEAAQIGVETVVTDKIGLDVILEYCVNQGSCSVLLDLGGESDDIVKVALEQKLVQKVVVEVLPLWAGGGANMPPTLVRLTQRINLKKLSAMTIGRSCLLEGYF